MSWVGNILLNDDTQLRDIELCSDRNPLISGLSNATCLTFLTVVETSRIPLHLVLETPCSVLTSNSDTENWFRSILLNTRVHHDNAVWWEAIGRDSPLGILVSVPATPETTPLLSKPRVTELLFYASPDGNKRNRPSSPRSPGPAPDAIANIDVELSEALHLHAVALSSDLLWQHQSNELTPPASPKAEDDDIEAVFIQPRFSAEANVINEPPVRKRKSATDAFDQASERRKGRRRGGEEVSALPSGITGVHAPGFRHQRSSSNTQSVHNQTRTLSRSPSVTSRPSTAVALTNVATATGLSCLSRVQSVGAAAEEASVETKNKDVISRIVMTGMRFHGLSQSKRRKSRAGSSAPSPALDGTFDELELERRNDEEFKLIYHQAFKGTCFAFRGIIADRNIQPCSEAVRHIADKLLDIFCSDPVAGSLAKDEETVMSERWETSRSSML